MQQVVQKLSEFLNSDSIWQAIEPIAPIIGIGVLVAFGYTGLNWALSHLSFYGGSVKGTISNYRHRNDW